MPAPAPADRTYAFQLPEALTRGAIVVDIRTQAQRQDEGTLPGALAIEPTVLAQRVDPNGNVRLALAVSHDVEWILVSSEGDSSTRAAVSLRQRGLHRVTAVVGGYQAIKAAGMVGSLVATAHCAREVATVTAH
ncbi:MAG: rhodanese-like domain-containing protein [Rhodococcus sp.]|nr:rhodanese-like domain-containing protein [Rhodococcus sp. (in: high G+C Gram-positive bacteria)]